MCHLGINAESQRQIFKVKLLKTCTYLLMLANLLQTKAIWLSLFLMILQILAGILQLGNVTFSTSMDESQPCSLGEESKGTRCHFKIFAHTRSLNFIFFSLNTLFCNTRLP